MHSENINIREIARIAGVSVASVSRALQTTPSPYLSEKQRKRILDICAEFHYQPNEHTRRMLSNKANTVSILFPPGDLISENRLGASIDSNFGACMLGAQKVLAANGIDLQLTEASESFISQKRYLKMIRGKMVDGILIWGILHSDCYIYELLEENFPVVMLQTEKPDCNCSKVLAADYNGMAVLTEKAIAAGHRKIAIMTPALAASTGTERLRGILETLRKHRIKPCFQTPDGNYSYEFGQSAALEILAHAPDTTFIIAPNDMSAWGCIEKLRELGYDVPEDISVTGADGMWVPGQLHLSTFYSPSYEIGRLGAELLINQIDKNVTSSERHVLPVRDIEGNTIKIING